MKKHLIRIASHLFPNWVAQIAYQQLTSPQVRKLRENELATLDQSIRETYTFKDYNIQLYTWKGGDETVLLIHGWEGQAGNFSDIIKSLLKNNYTVYAFDGPSHGFSSKGKTSLFEFTELVGILVKKFQPNHLISHSFGGVPTTYALKVNTDVQIDKYILLTTPDKFTERIDEIAETVGINQKVKDLLTRRLEKETQQDIRILNVSEFVKSVNVRHPLIIHDQDDKVIPIQRSMNVHKNWEGSRLHTVKGTGHFRILRTPEVIQSVIEFLN